MSETATRTARIEARISQEALKLVKRAAEIEGRSISDFVATAAQAAARQTIADVEVISLSHKAQELRRAAPESSAAVAELAAGFQASSSFDRRHAMNPPFVTEPLDRRHDRTSIRSGSETLDRYFRERVTQGIRRRVAACFVAADEQGAYS